MVKAVRRRERGGGSTRGANRAGSSGVKKIEICVSAPTAALDRMVARAGYGMAWHGRA